MTSAPLRRILVIDGHPDGDPNRYVHALAQRYVAGAEASGHALRHLAICEMAFPLITDRKIWEGEDLPPAIREAQEAIIWAEHLLIIYPLWLGDMPARLKGFFEQVFRPGFAFDPHASDRFPRKRLKGRTARIVVTMGMPALIYRAFYGAHSVRNLERNILSFVGIRPVRRVLIGSIEGQASARERWLDALHAWGVAGA